MLEPDKHELPQPVDKARHQVTNHANSMYFWYNVIRMAPLLFDHPPKTL